MLKIDIHKQLDSGKESFVLEAKLQVQGGEIVALMGPSGAGKTTLLQILAGLSSADRGSVKLKNRSYQDTATQTFLKPQDRRIAYIFQEGGLFPHMTLKENLRFALPPGASSETLEANLHKLDLADMKQRRPDQLSGGQRQRAVLLRAMLQQPHMLLMDEPLSAQDEARRAQLGHLIQTWIRPLHIPVIWVSHDAEEVLNVADRVVYMEEGKIQRIDSPKNILLTPPTETLRGRVSEVQKDFVIVQIGRQQLRLPYQEKVEKGVWIDVFPLSGTYRIAKSPSTDT